MEQHLKAGLSCGAVPSPFTVSCRDQTGISIIMKGPEQLERLCHILPGPLRPEKFF